MPVTRICGSDFIIEEHKHAGSCPAAIALRWFLGLQPAGALRYDDTRVSEALLQVAMYDGRADRVAPYVGCCPETIQEPVHRE